ncbi:DUF4265 domain-containing protein [Subtercola vilae]|uniref:DUF4265 domain-containing protein n=1 Tax=Subtercola vilae TaxID=2056433 RepID=A0A4T2BUA5_9MICO|nr:DUF4265 domain-containing protein [Subtercola vilae]
MSNGWPSFTSEGLWAAPLPAGTYQLQNSPFFAAGLSIGDEISLCRSRRQCSRRRRRSSPLSAADADRSELRRGGTSRHSAADASVAGRSSRREGLRGGARRWVPGAQAPWWAHNLRRLATFHAQCSAYSRRTHHDRLPRGADGSGGSRRP